MTELNIEVDKNNNIIGLRPRADFHTGKYICRLVYLILLNSKNEMLLQLRSKSKKWYPNLFVFSVAGTVTDETYEECIQREIKEEIGINIPVKRLFVFPYFSEVNKAFRAVFIGKITDEKITPDETEMQLVKWINLNELRKDLIENPQIYVPPFVKGMEIFFSEYYDKGKII